MTAALDVEKAISISKGTATADAVTESGTDDAAPPAAEGLQPPDGGFTAWSQVFAAALVNSMSWGYPSMFGVYQLHYRDALKLPDSQISWIGSLQIFLAFVMCTFSGRMADAGYVKTTIAVGSFLVVFGTFMTSLCTEYWQIFLAQGLCTGLGLGIMFMPPISVVNSYFVHKRSLALALAASGTGFGSVIFPATIQYLIPQIGFPWAVRCAAFLALIMSAVAILILRPRLTPRKSGPLVEWDAFREGPYLLYILGAFLFFWALYFGFFYINAYARNVIHFSTTDSVQLLRMSNQCSFVPSLLSRDQDNGTVAPVITNGMSIPSRPLVGFLADRYLGPINMYAFHVLVLGCMLFAWTGVTTRAGMYVFSVFFGLANGAAQGLFTCSLASLTKDPRKMGTRYGMVCTIIAFASLAGPPTAGAIIDKSAGQYLWAQVWAGLVIVLGSVALAGCRCAVSGFKLWVKV
ncbi:MFS general substrate transporter [Parathielavia appendiculata]|uniref:MFS general substrate transporter n=1 Tax=Parathielavia appendiculata TaxID=2587402 RepID=A0AAN6TZ26_9PEZI|nr:MFS general substrate transporter [Parathielavia appendiculata]